MVFMDLTHVVIPGVVPVVDDGSAKAPRRVDAGASDRDGGQVHQEHDEPNWQQVQGSVHPRKKPSVKHVNCHAPNL
jgi:hypothetical protein